MSSKVQQHYDASRKIGKQGIVEVKPLKPYVNVAVLPKRSVMDNSSANNGLELVSDQARIDRRLADPWTPSFGTNIPLPVACNDNLTGRTSYTALLRLPKCYQPSRAEPFQQHLVAHFITCFFAPQSARPNEKVWEHWLPAFLSDCATPAVTFFIRAATMAVYGQLIGDKSI